MTILNKLKIIYNAITPSGDKSQEYAESNAVNTEILSYLLSKVIRSDKTTVKEGENVCHTVTVSNNSSTKLFNNYFTIPQPDGTSYVAGSVKVNGITQPAYDPIAGFTLPDLNPGETAIIEYTIKANAPSTTAPVTHLATIKYTVNDPIRGNVNYSENTDTILLNIVSDKISVVKNVDKAFAVKGENLHYTVNITNMGNVTKGDLIFKDPIPDGTTFVSNSIKIDGTDFSVYNPEIGFVLRSLAPGETITVEFDVKVN